jgi:hypothetical protein
MYKGAQIAEWQRTGHPVSLRSDLSVSFLVPLCQLDFRVYASDGTVLWRRSFLRIEVGWLCRGGTGDSLICAIFLCSHRVNHAVQLPPFYPGLATTRPEPDDSTFGLGVWVLRPIAVN